MQRLTERDGDKWGFIACRDCRKPHCTECDHFREQAAALAAYEDAPVYGLNDLAVEVHKNAVAHGWYEEKRSFPEVVALFHSELSEALEEYRRDRPGLYYACWRSDVPYCDPSADCKYKNEGTCARADDDPGKGKPQGVVIELADCIIRILDTCHKEGYDIERAIRLKHEYNKTRPYRHGGKKC
jgi:hypothetical protein